MSNEDLWRLNHGYHNFSLTSRGIENTYHPTRQNAEASYKEKKDYLAVLGYVTWFANLYSPEGKVIVIDRGVPY